MPIKKWFWGLLSLAFIGVLFAPTHVFAETQTEKTDFEIQPILPDAQTNMSLNYFDLLYPKNSSHVIQMRVQNFSDKNIVVRSDLRNAMTQVGGGINFTPSLKSLDRSLKYPFTTRAKLNKGAAKIALAPHQVKVISATVTMPKDNYSGMIYGDWHFIEHVDKGKTSANAVGSNYAYSLGVVLRGKNYAIFPNLEYDKTEAILYQKHPALGVNLRNTTAMAISKGSVRVAVGTKNGAVRTYIASNFTVAPNSKLTLPVSWSYDTMQPGTYNIKVTFKGVNSANNFPVNWTFKKTMKISSTDVKSINRQAMKQPTNHWLYATIGVGALLLVSLGALGWTIKIRV